MYDSHILGSQYLIDSILLCRIQIREMHRLEDKGLHRSTGREEVAQLAQAPLPLNSTIEGFHHQAVTRLVK